MPKFLVSEYHVHHLDRVWEVEVTVEGYPHSIWYEWRRPHEQPNRREWQISCFRQHLQTCASRHEDAQSIFEELHYACREYEAHPRFPGEEMQFVWWLSQLPKPAEPEDR